ncbi:Hypothetical predicted protein [Prunus dulcis]|uniref:Uncharacterized protein n=1 Tax=Prunus dulcis TaxID=3755 RepID=A0A5E4FXS2_PRUDU|nr:hypothetical protein L3X38_038229 [Prunus dulcis]VVA32355.1 Hypothetical predicted protein [Prunus dulcis]
MAELKSSNLKMALKQVSLQSQNHVESQAQEKITRSGYAMKKLPESRPEQTKTTTLFPARVVSSRPKKTTSSSVKKL